jgi:hypothetical protein
LFFRLNRRCLLGCGLLRLTRGLRHRRLRYCRLLGLNNRLRYLLRVLTGQPLLGRFSGGCSRRLYRYLLRLLSSIDSLSFLQNLFFLTWNVLGENLRGCIH